MSQRKLQAEPLSETWCGRRESNPHRPFEPCGFSYRLRLSPPGSARSSVSGLRSGLSLHPLPDDRGLGAARLVSTPSRLSRAGLGSGLPLSGGFPEFGLFCIAGFPSEHSSFFSSPLRLPFRHARVWIWLPSIIGQIRILSPVRLPVSPPWPGAPINCGSRLYIFHPLCAVLRMFGNDSVLPADLARSAIRSQDRIENLREIGVETPAGDHFSLRRAGNCTAFTLLFSAGFGETSPATCGLDRERTRSTCASAPTRTTCRNLEVSAPEAKAALRPFRPRLHAGAALPKHGVGSGQKAGKAAGKGTRTTFGLEGSTAHRKRSVPPTGSSCRRESCG
jgi:hypothetical protein